MKRPFYKDVLEGKAQIEKRAFWIDVVEGKARLTSMPLDPDGKPTVILSTFVDYPLDSKWGKCIQSLVNIGCNVLTYEDQAIYAMACGKESKHAWLTLMELILDSIAVPGLARYYAEILIADHVWDTQKEQRKAIKSRHIAGAKKHWERKGVPTIGELEALFALALNYFHGYPATEDRHQFYRRIRNQCKYWYDRHGERITPEHVRKRCHGHVKEWCKKYKPEK